MRYALLLAAFAWTITLTPPADVKAGAEMPLHATITDEQGMPVKGADVEMVVTMVDMDHGEFKHPAKEVSPGNYEAPAAKFYMAGTWNVKVKAQKGPESSAKDFKIDVKH